MQRLQTIIFTDLDGTLLDHHSYSWQAATPALAMLRQQQIPLILCTIKTTAEVAVLHQELNLSSPYIVENGAAIILSAEPKPAHFFGSSYQELLDLVHELRNKQGYRFSGFNDFTSAEVAAETGLNLAQAELAKQRLCSEPIRWEDDEQALQRFQKDLAAHNLQLLRGGRFYHILSKTADKGAALRWLLNNYPAKPNCAWRSVALGDGPNDQSLLDAADLAVVIPSQSGASPRPVGWNQTILEILK